MGETNEKQAYFDARNRALERLVEGIAFHADAGKGFMDALLCVDAHRVETDKLLESVLPESNHGFAAVCGVLMKLEAVKGKHYAASFFKRGEKDGIKTNVDRKYDRIEEILAHPESGSGETLTQTIGDLAVYLIKWLTVRAVLQPQEFEAWVQEVANL